MSKEKEDVIDAYGVVTSAKGNGMFEVLLESGSKIIARIGGKIKRHNIKIMEGSRVKLEISVYDLTKGRIVYRLS